MGARSRRPGLPPGAALAIDGAQLSPEPPAGESAPSLVSAAGSDRGEAQDRPSPWPARIMRVVEVMVWLELGLILLIVPWKRAWTDNSLVLNYPQLRAFLEMNFIRGAVSGIGLLDLWVGISRAVGYKDPGKV